MKKKRTILAEIQDLEDRMIERFCSVKRRVQLRTKWMPDETSYLALAEEVREHILFHEERGYYLFQEPVLEHEPVKKRYRALLTFRPTELNR